MSKAHLIVFEGPDGVGKTTLVSRYGELLRAGGRTVTSIAFPGNEAGTLGHHVYGLHHDPGRFGVRHMTAASLQMLHIAAHADVIESVIWPRVRAGETVLLDRYWWSTWVYGVDSGVSTAALESMIACERVQWGALVPSVLLLIARATPLGREDAPGAWRRRMSLYSELAAREALHHPVCTVNNQRTVDDAVREVEHAVTSVLGPNEPGLSG